MSFVFYGIKLTPAAYRTKPYTRNWRILVHTHWAYQLHKTHVKETSQTFCLPYLSRDYNNPSLNLLKISFFPL